MMCEEPAVSEVYRKRRGSFSRSERFIAEAEVMMVARRARCMRLFYASKAENRAMSVVRDIENVNVVCSVFQAVSRVVY